jgi:hypothetical protein
LFYGLVVAFPIGMPTFVGDRCLPVALSGSLSVHFYYDFKNIRQKPKKYFKKPAVQNKNGWCLKIVQANCENEENRVIFFTKS